MRRFLYAAMLVMVFATAGHASIRSLWQEKAYLFLHEKVGKPENLLDNPARLCGMHRSVVSNDTLISMRRVQPYDPVYEKEVQENEMSVDTHAILPIQDIVYLHAGYQYDSIMDASSNQSTIDDTVINLSDKTFRKTIYLSAASSYWSWFDLGYDVRQENKNHFIDYASNLATDYTYANDHRRIRHGAGVVVSGDWELYGNFSTETYQGTYTHASEVDFTTTGMEIKARKVFGKMNETNVLLEAGLATCQLEQNKFDIGREGYDLTIPADIVSLNGYFYHPLDRWDVMAGIEIVYEDDNIFDVSEYKWIVNEGWQASLPLQVNYSIMSWMQVWIEMKFDFQKSTFENQESFSLENALGLKFNVYTLEIQAYLIPSFEVVSSEKSDTIQQVQGGINITAEF